MTESREVTTVEYVWDRSTLTWVAGEPVITTETRDRAMTDAELAECSEITPPEEEPPGDEAGPGETPASEGPASLSQTGAESISAMVALSITLLVAGAAVLLVRRRLAE